MSAPVALDAPAAPIPCGRCGTPVLLAPGGRCADCIADMGLHHPDEHQAWHDQLRAEYAEHAR